MRIVLRNLCLLDDVDSSPAAQKTFPVSAAHVEAFNPSQGEETTGQLHVCEIIHHDATLGTSARHENKYRPSSSLQGEKALNFFGIPAC